jgi:hypothetical protein
MTNRDKLMAEALWHIDAECETHGWDQNAGLFAVLIHRFGDEGGAIQLAPMIGWDVCLQLAPGPREALAGMVHMLRAAPVELKRSTYPREVLYGVAIVTEAWMLRGDAITPETRLAVGERRLHELPDRVEIRFTYCVSTQGEVSALAHERDGIAESLGDGEAKLDGAIPDLLTQIVKELAA